MKPFLTLALTLLATLCTAGVLPVSPHNLTNGPDLNSTVTDAITPFSWTGPAIAADDDEAWKASIERGTKLLAGMKGSDSDAAALYGMSTSAESAFDGSLEATLHEWGYNDNTPAMQSLWDRECNFDSRTSDGHMLKKTFLDLGLNTRSKGQSGPNQCFQIEHFDSPAVQRDENGDLPAKQNQRYTVCGKEYRITNAEHSIGVNAAGGAVFAMSIRSAASAARRLWKRPPLAEELPHIRSVSDIAWAFWNRAHAATPGSDMQNIRYFVVTMIINTETSKHIRRALASLSPPREEADGWPGHEFSMESDAGKALLGSPVGRWAGYFLMQHKRQLGGSKWIDRVRVFKSEKAGSLPYLLFYVHGPVVVAAVGSTSDQGVGGSGEGSRIVKRSGDGKNVVREHVIRVGL